MATPSIYFASMAASAHGDQDPAMNPMCSGGGSAPPILDWRQSYGFPHRVAGGRGGRGVQRRRDLHGGRSTAASTDVAPSLSGRGGRSGSWRLVRWICGGGGDNKEAKHPSNPYPISGGASPVEHLSHYEKEP